MFYETDEEPQFTTMRWGLNNQATHRTGSVRVLTGIFRITAHMNSPIAMPFAAKTSISLNPPYFLSPLQWITLLDV